MSSLIEGSKTLGCCDCTFFDRNSPICRIDRCTNDMTIYRCQRLRINLMFMPSVCVATGYRTLGILEKASQVSPESAAVTSWDAFSTAVGGKANKREVVMQQWSFWGCFVVEKVVCVSWVVLRLSRVEEKQKRKEKISFRHGFDKS